MALHLGRQLLLYGWHYATSPLRAHDARQRREQGQEPVQILFYHRVADEHPNPWTMPTRTFTWQIDYLAARFDLVSLAEAQRRIASGWNLRPTAAITFDDGYADNLRWALPLLAERGIPYTYFVTTDNIRKRRAFPHDVARGVPLELNTVGQIRQLAEAGVEIGAHTRTHADLGKLTGHELAREITGSKWELERITGQPVRYFAFPFGLNENITCEGMRIARDAGFEGVCSAFGGYNFPGEDAFHLKRFHADVEKIRLKQWLGVGRRKVRLSTAMAEELKGWKSVEESVFPAVSSPDSSSLCDTAAQREG